MLTVVVVPLMAVSAWADYKEAPMLAARVAAGELPPVEYRLPLEPKVRAVFDEIGTYGGQVTVFGNSPNPWAPLMGENPEGTPTPIRMNFDGSFEPDLALDYDLSDDYLTFTLTVREGSKWSNGDPFTAEDFSFHFNDMQKAELGYVWGYPSQVKTVTAVDDVTVVIEYSEPYPKVAQDLVTYKGTDWTLYQPSTWLKQWHAEYNENANAKAKEEGFEDWQEAFSDHSTFCCPQRNIERPTMAPFMLADVQPTFRLKERNPYYFAVDSAGQQLPYLDSGLIQIISDREARRLKIIGGEADFATIPLDAYPLLVQGQQAGNYKLHLLEAWFEGTGLAYAFNLNIKDEAKRPFFENVEFRRAISLAIDRERINEAQWLGQGTPSQMTITKLASIYRPEWGEDHPYARHAPDEANRMLDALGLDKRNDDGIRLLPNGEPFIVINAFSGATPIRAYELVKEDFEAVGIGLELRPADGSVIDQGMSGGTIDFVRWNETIGEFQDYLSGGGGHTQSLSHMARQYWDWWQEMNKRRIGVSNETGDLPGEEPPPELKEYFDTQIVESKRHPYGSPEQKAASSKAWELQAEWLWNIGVVQAAPMVLLYRSNLANVPDKVPPFFEGDIGFNLYADQMFFAGAQIVPFPWPPPKPTTRYEIGRTKLAQEASQPLNLGHIDNVLSLALTAGGYSERGYFYVPQGFVIVPKMEKFDCGNGTSEEDISIRWETKYTPFRFVELLSDFGQYVKHTFTGPPEECFRTMVIAVTTEDHFRTTIDTSLTWNRVAKWWNQSDRSRLPSDLHDAPFGKSHIAVVLIYEFRRRGNEPLSFVEQSPISAICHLNGGGTSVLLTEPMSSGC